MSTTTNQATTMKAIARDSYGSPDLLRLDDIDTPLVGDDDVLVHVHAAGLDQGVWHHVTGLPYAIRLAGFGLRRPRVRVPGTDVAGTVAAVGQNVARFRPGDDVFGNCAGSFAEYACAPQDQLAAKPAGVTFERAAAVPASGMAAVAGLRDAGKVQAGQAVLIIGASGGVGTFAVQLAKVFGAHVTGVCSTTKAHLVRSIGADNDVVDYTREDFADRAARYDLILDIAGNQSLSRLLPNCRLVRATPPRIGGDRGG